MSRRWIALFAVVLTSPAARATPYDCTGVILTQRPDNPLEQRVRAQHELLELANRLDARGDAGHAARAIVMALVRASAPTADELATLGSSTEPRVDLIFGHELMWQRATQSCGTGSLIHVFAAGGLLAYRPVRAGDTHALVAQLVAFDRDGRPHITPLIEEVELRVGDGAAAPACVVQADEDDGTLHAMPFDELRERPPFVIRIGNGVGCANCHGDGHAIEAHDIAGAELARVDAARTRQVTVLATELWRRLQP
jgi:hypothetical protein